MDMEHIEVIENAEDAYNAFAAKAEDAPHKWGREESDKLHQMAQTLKRLYESSEIPEDDRISL